MRFRKKPVIVEAVQWTGLNRNQLGGFMGTPPKVVDNQRLRVYTMEGAIYAKPGDWIIRGFLGEFYPCDNEVFEATYEPVEEE